MYTRTYAALVIRMKYTRNSPTTTGRCFVGVEAIPDIKPYGVDWAQSTDEQTNKLTN